MNKEIKDPEGNPIIDREGRPIKDGDFVSLDGNITADDSMSDLPNGWTFEEEDIYQVYFEKEINTWSLKLGVEPDNAYNVKYLNHAVGLLHAGEVTIVENYKSR